MAGFVWDFKGLAPGKVFKMSKRDNLRYMKKDDHTAYGLWNDQPYEIDPTLPVWVVR